MPNALRHENGGVGCSQIDSDPSLLNLTVARLLREPLLPCPTNPSEQGRSPSVIMAVLDCNLEAWIPQCFLLAVLVWPRWCS